jgi:hypothetical protein
MARQVGWLACLALAVASAALVAACGGDDAGDGVRRSPERSRRSLKSPISRRR